MRICSNDFGQGRHSEACRRATVDALRRAVPLVVALVLLLFAATAFAAEEAPWPPLRQPAPEWLQRPDVAMQVRWVRIYGSIPDTRDGVCTVFYPDTSERDLDAAESQVEQCARSGAALLTAQPGAVLVYWHRRAGTHGVRAAWLELFGRRIDEAAGFYYRDEGGVCHVVTAGEYRTLGHELKHCFDGDWHAASSALAKARSR